MIKFINKNEIEYIPGGIEIQNNFENNVSYLIALLYPTGKEIFFSEHQEFHIKNSASSEPRLRLLVLTDGENYYHTNYVNITDYKKYKNYETNQDRLLLAQLEQRIKQLENKNTFTNKLNVQPTFKDKVGSVVTLVDGNKFELRQPYSQAIRNINGLTPNLNGKINLTMTDIGFNEERHNQEMLELLDAKNNMLIVLEQINERLSNVEQNQIDSEHNDVL